MRVISFLLCLLISGAAQDKVPETEPTFRTSTTQVLVDVLVANDKGVVSGLRQEDFIVTDEGATVPVRYFAKDDAMLNVLLLLDVSGSMKNYLEQIGKRARFLLEELREQDKVGVMIFSKETDYMMPFTSNVDRAANAIDQSLRPNLLPGGTAINLSILDAAEAFAEGKNLTGHRAIFILTDNRGLNYRAPDDVVLKKLFANDTVLNAIVTRNAEPPKPLKNPESRNPDFTYSDVFKLAAETGGEVLRGDRADESLRVLMKNLRQRYLLGYDAPKGRAAGFHKIQVSLTREAQKRHGKVVIRARAGYYTGS